MEQSLTVPTATSVRNMPVKVLVENRTIINENLKRSGRGKVSFTHLIAWAIVKAMKTYPQMNNGYGMVDGKPSRLENESINLGIAIDIEKKDGSRNLLVPNIKGCEKMNFAEFFAAYNETVKKARTRKINARRFCRNDDFADKSGNARHGRFESASDERSKRDYRHGRNRISGGISGNDRRRDFRSSASAARSH